MTPKTVIFIGPQGSGKGTQVEKLESALAASEVVNIQTGRLFRALAAEDSFTSQRVNDLIVNGDLVPDFLTNALWISDMADKLSADSHLLIDGFPRNVAQAEIVADAMKFYQREEVIIINLDTAEDVVVERMLERGRSDDTPDSIQNRLAQYKAETMPVLDYYRAQDGATVHDINGAESIEEVHQAITKALNI